MADDLGVAEYEEADSFVFRDSGAVCVHSEAQLADCQPAVGSAQLVAASDRFALVFFADALGAPLPPAPRRASLTSPRAPTGLCTLRLDEVLQQAESLKAAARR